MADPLLEAFFVFLVLGWSALVRWLIPPPSQGVSERKP